MDDPEIHRTLYQVRKAMGETTATLARIEERLKNFISDVEKHEKEIEKIQEHVHTVKTVSKISAWSLGFITTVLGIFWQATKH